MFGEACDILLIRVICLNIKGASAALTPKPQSTINGSQGIPVLNYKLIRQDAVKVKTGWPQAHIKGKL